MKNSDLTPQEQLINLKQSLENIPLPLNNPHTLSESCVRLAALLAECIEPLSDLETDYQLSKGEEYAINLEMGMKPTPAKDATDMKPHIIQKKSRLDYWKAYLKAKENIVFRIENHLRTEINLERKGL